MEELRDLISSLEDLQRRAAYIQIKAVTGILAEMYRSNCGLMVKRPEYFAPDASYKYAHDVKDLFSAFCQLLDREELSSSGAAKAVLYPQRVTYSVTEKASEILKTIKLRGAARISALIRSARSRSEIVAVFIAVLELCRTGAICLVGCDEDLTLCGSGREERGDDELSGFDESPAE